MTHSQSTPSLHGSLSSGHATTRRQGTNKGSGTMIRVSQTRTEDGQSSGACDSDEASPCLGRTARVTTAPPDPLEPVSHIHRRARRHVKAKKDRRLLCFSAWAWLWSLAMDIGSVRRAYLSAQVEFGALPDDPLALFEPHIADLQRGTTLRDQAGTRRAQSHSRVKHLTISTGAVSCLSCVPGRGSPGWTPRH